MRLRVDHGHIGRNDHDKTWWSVISSGLTAHFIWIPATFRSFSPHFSFRLWLPQMVLMLFYPDINSHADTMEIPPAGPTYLKRRLRHWQSNHCQNWYHGPRARKRLGRIMAAWDPRSGLGFSGTMDVPYMEISINGGTPSYHPFQWDFPLETNHSGDPPHILICWRV